MSKNHYLMTERATAQVEVDYLRDELKKAKDKLKDVSVARKLLESKGYFVRNLWSTDDVTENYECTREQALEVLGIALTNESTMQDLWLAIDYACDLLGIKKNESNENQ